MFSRNIILSLIHFFLVIGLILSGVFFLILHFVPTARVQATEVFSSQTPFFLILGGGLLLFAVALFISFSRMHHKHYYRVSMNGHEMEVDDAVLKGIIEQYWKRIFPDQHVATDLILHPKKQKIEIVVEIPGLPFEDHEALLQRVEKELGEILTQQLGYKKEFFVSILLK